MDCCENNETMAHRSDRGGTEPITILAFGAVAANGFPPAHSILARSFDAPFKGRRYDCSQTSRRRPPLSTQERKNTM